MTGYGTKILKLVFAKVANYEATVSHLWCSPLPPTRLLVVATFLMIAISMLGNNLVRAYQLEVWQSVPDQASNSGSAMFSTADAPFFLRHAKTVLNNETTADFDSSRLFPNLTTQSEELASDDPLQSRPLLSVLLSLMTDIGEVDQLVTSGNTLILFTSAATALMIAICFGAAGYWFQGAVAALGGGLSGAYIVRSSIGRIDTDQLNLGFIYLLFGLVVFASRAQSRRQSLG